MLMAILLASLLGGGSAELFVRDDFRAVERIIEEPERAAAATATMQRINNRLNGLFNQRRELVASLDALDLDVDASADAYEKHLDELWQRREQATDGTCGTCSRCANISHAKNGRLYSIRPRTTSPENNKPG